MRRRCSGNGDVNLADPAFSTKRIAGALRRRFFFRAPALLCPNGKFLSAVRLYPLREPYLVQSEEEDKKLFFYLKSIRRHD